MIQTFAGYDAKSPTLIRSPLFGDCMRGIIPEEYRTCYVDRAAPIASGDLVRLWIAPPGGVQAIVKQLRVSRDGRFWGYCSDGVFQIGTLVRPFNIEKVVALSTEVIVSTQGMTLQKADDETQAHFAMLAEDVVREWRELGHVAGVPFPGLDRVNYYLPDNTSTRNPNYESPRPL